MLRVVYALILREIKSRFGEQRLGYIWALLEPIIFVAVLSTIWSFRGSDSISGMGLELFMVTGFVPFFLFRNIMSACMRALAANRQLLTFPQVQFYDLILARFLLEFCTSIIVFIIIVSGIYLTGLDNVAIDFPLGVLIGFCLMALFGLGLGLCLSSLLPIFPSMQPLSEAFLGRPLFLTSGLFFSADMLPESARPYLLMNPLFQIIEYTRGSFFKGVESPYFDPEYTIIFLIILLFIGMLMQRALHRYTLKLI